MRETGHNLRKINVDAPAFTTIIYDEKYQEVSNTNHFGTVPAGLGRLASASHCMDSVLKLLNSTHQFIIVYTLS